MKKIHYNLFTLAVILETYTLYDIFWSSLSTKKSKLKNLAIIFSFITKSRF